MVKDFNNLLVLLTCITFVIWLISYIVFFLWNVSVEKKHKLLQQCKKCQKFFTTTGYVENIRCPNCGVSRK